MQKISVIFVDDHLLVRETWTSFINLDKRFEVIAECSSAEKAFELVTTYKPDVVLMDINLPGMNGIEATAKILQLSPNTKVLGLSAHKQPDYARSMMRNGATGYLSKFASRDELIQAIIDVAAGKKYICNTVKDIVARQLFEDPQQKKGIDALSPREMEVIGLIKEGKISKEIATALNLSVKTIEVHRYNILKKLGLKNTSALIYFVNKHIVH